MGKSGARDYCSRRIANTMVAYSQASLHTGESLLGKDSSTTESV